MSVAGGGKGFQHYLDRVASEIKDEIKELRNQVGPVNTKLELVDQRVSSLERKQADTTNAIERLIRLEERLAGVLSWGGNVKWVITTLIAISVPVAIKLIFG